MKNIRYVFYPQSIAIIGASREPNKIGNVIVKNLVEGGYRGKIYPVNPNTEEILGLKCYKSISEIQNSVDCAVICIKKEFVLDVVQQCANKKVKSIIMITSGFSETGNEEMEKKILSICKQNEIALIGPNCMGVIYTKNRVDSVFLPVYKMGRPKIGGISFISQSGAIGGCILDLAAYYGIGMNKFVSYGNGKLIGVEELLEYFESDNETKTLACYFEGIRDGKRFINALDKCTLRKPVVVLKGGKTSKSAKAIASHTSSLMGNHSSFRAVFKKTNTIEVESIDELFDVVKVFMQPKIKGKRIGVITNGGGLGILVVDKLVENDFELSEIPQQKREELRKIFPSELNIENPLDLLGDANTARFEVALNTMMNEESVDAIIVCLLLQTISLDATIINVLVRTNYFSKKPILIVAVGGEYTNSIVRVLESNNLPCYPSPERAVNALRKMYDYYENLNHRLSGNRKN
ncbi:MAG: CoA-binding protein [Candidatus Micrarchaeota archaeon]|nr:CoA-binding protein [Candidatus Micrarchaeota archaeon]